MNAIQEIVRQHAEDAAFLWLLRSGAISASHFSLQDLADLDNRVEAHIDGLRVAGDAGWEICREALSWKEPGEIFAAGVLAFECGDKMRIETVLEAVGEDPVLARGLISALGWVDYGSAAPFIDGFLSSDSPFFRYIGVATGAVHRQCRMDALTAAAHDDNPLLRARALKAIGEMGKREFQAVVKNHLADEDETCRFWAAWSAAVFSDSSAAGVLRAIAEAGGPYTEAACRTVMNLMHHRDDREWLASLQHHPEKQRIAVIGAGALGDSADIPWLIRMMEIPELARPAGEAFTFITGVDIAYLDLEGEWPEGFEAGPTEAPEDDNVDLDPDEDLPWPAPERISAWWDQNRQNFRASESYFLGKPVTAGHLETVLRTGLQRQRKKAAVMLAARHPRGIPVFETRAPGFRQKQILGVS
ncbi:TIGR02270 family protein [Desulfococcus sp.]|uniref:TIGR02270 family protein n=1 Tax=Desulfococcus sp. TaxID=2025834 RepID=UPI003593DADB